MWLTSNFNNRELAVGIWVFIGLLFCLLKADLRKSIWHLIVSLFDLKLISFFGTIALTIATLCWLFTQVGVWSYDQIPATILWFLLEGSGMAGSALQAREDEGHFRGLFLGSLKLGGVFAFIVVVHSFSLMIELVLVPALSLLGVLLSYATTKPEYAQVKTLIESILTAIVVIFLWNSVSQVLDQPGEFFTTDTGRNFVLPILLTIGCIPVFYVWYCYSHIEQARIQIDQNIFQSDEVKIYARKRFFLIFMARPWLLRRAVRQFRILPAKTKDDVARIINAILQFERENRAPPEVDSSKGWCPYLAREFIAELGLRTNDYHLGHDGEYWAESTYIDLDDHIFPINGIFYLEGEEGLVRKLKLIGKFMDDFPSEKGMRRFLIIAKALCDAALGDHPLDIDKLLPNVIPFDQTDVVGNTTINTYAERYPSQRGAEIFLILSR